MQPENPKANKHLTPRFFYGWYIVGVGFIGDFMAVGMGPIALGVFLRPMRMALGWSFTKISTAFAIQGVLSMLLGPIVGLLLDRFGARPVMAFGAIVAGTGLILMGFVQHLWQFYVLFAVIGALGLQEAGHMATSVAVSKWFVRKLGRALAISSLGVPTGAVVVAPLTGILIFLLGWRGAWAALGLILLVVLLPPVLLLVRRSPEDMGLFPDGEDPASPSAESRRGTGPIINPAESDWTLTAALATGTLWILILASNLGGLTRSTLNIHLINYIQDLGQPASVASFIFSMTYVGSILSRAVYGFALERVPVRYCLAGNLLGQSLGLLFLMVLPFPFGVLPFILGNGLFGGGFGFISSYAWANYYGRRFLGSIRGVHRMFMISNLAGPVFAAIVRDLTGSYQSAFFVVIFMGMASAFLMLQAKRPVRKTV